MGNDRNVILNLAVSLDGFISGPNGEYDWCFTDQDYGMAEFLQSIDSIIMGRHSFELLDSIPESSFPMHKKYVFSNTLNIKKDDVHIVRESPESFINRIKQQPGKHMWLFGGAELAGSFLRKALIDEMHLAIHPVMLGAGKPIFENVHTRTYLEFLSARTFSSGLIQLKYRRKVSSEI